MRRCSILLTLIVMSCLASVTHGQTLTDKLIAENPTKLAEAARSNGNIVRGAILFHQGNINCAKCHRANAEAERIGPDLSRLDQETTDTYLVESILQPANTIKKGFETATVLTLDGKTVNGLIVERTAEKVVLRDNQNVDQLITILSDDIDEIRAGSKSSMPDGLANELKSRQQFLDLLRYVIDVKERGPTAEAVSANSNTDRALSPELSGLVLMNERNCTACHQSNTALSLVSANQAPNLNWSGKWLNPYYVQRFIAAPHQAKPGATMPHLLNDLDETTRSETAAAITHFLVAHSGNQFQPQSVDKPAVLRGDDLFHSVGCVACHSPRSQSAVEKPLIDSAPLGDLTLKYSVDGLVAFLENPHAARPSGRMPNMNLTHKEAIDIASFLLQNPGENPAPWQLDADLASKGKSHFAKFNCASCHTDVTNPEPTPASRTPLARMNSEQGCLSGKPGAWPDFQFNQRETVAIRAALKNHPNDLTNHEQIAISLKSFNCIACHDREGFGGVSSFRNPHFQTTNLNLGDQGRIPPTLTGVGAKLNPKWMRDVLVNRRVIRPYMKTRMPQYGEENIGHLVELFQTTDKLATTTFATFDDQKEMRKLGLKIAGNQGLNCVACHTYKYKLSDTMPAVDLTEMTDRLKKDWFYQYMLVPQKFSPNTVMPSFWPGGTAIRKDLEGDSKHQIEALWQYLIDGRQAGTPRGVVREPLEIVVTDEAKMLRRNYRGIGKRGIGVGYPGGVNLAFDAEQLRLAMVWKGKFADPVGAWTGQGNGSVRPLEKPIEFTRGPDLDDLSHPWIADETRPPNHQFLGYILDKSRRPTFNYRFDSVEVQDFFAPVVDSGKQTSLRRSISISSQQRRDQLRFRVASGSDVLDKGEQKFGVGKQLIVHIVSEHSAQIVDLEDGMGLEIPINLGADESQNLIIEYSWQ